jgi:Cu+-exporting ATPase
MLAILSFVPAALQASEGTGASAQQAAGSKTQKATLSVEKLACGSCADKIKKALLAKPGVTAVQVDVPQSRVEVDYQADKTDPKALAKVVSDLGYPAKPVAPAAPAKEAKAAAGCAGKCCEDNSTPPKAK